MSDMVKDWLAECTDGRVSKQTQQILESFANWQAAAIAAMQADAAPVAETRFYIDCEFDGHDGPLLSIALVKGNGSGIYIVTTTKASDPWVIANVVPLIDQHDCRMAVRCLPNEVGAVIRTFIDCDNPIIVADSPVDIGRFCRALSTGPDGQWASAEYPAIRFEVHNVDCYPTTLKGAVQHNAWWDAMALKTKLDARVSTSSPVDVSETPETSGKLRPAVEVVQDAVSQTCRNFRREPDSLCKCPHCKAAAAVIEADRAALVAEIVADLHDLDGMRDETNLIGWAANQIEAKWGGK